MSMTMTGVWLYLLALTLVRVQCQIQMDQECEGSLGCFHDCSTPASCLFLVSWKVNEATSADYAEYTLKTQPPVSDSFWVALGFSADQSMGNDSVSGCIHNRTGTPTTSVFNAKNNGHRPAILLSDGLTLKNSSLENGIFTCVFTRQKAEGLNGDRYDITKPWYLLFAKGEHNGTGLRYHGPNQRFFSSQRYTAISATPVPTTPTLLTGSITSDSECGTKKGCFRRCTGTSCSFQFSWYIDGNYGVYSLSAVVVSSGAWVALGFSTDAYMADDSVIGCRAGSDLRVEEFAARNPKHASPVDYSNSSVSLISYSYADEVLTCTIRLPITPTVNESVDLSQKWTYLYASGEASGSFGQVTMNYHGVNRAASELQLSVNDTTVSGSGSSYNALVKAHGSLMIVAWVFLASIGIVTARYCKPMWVVKLLSEKVWFQIHRLCMILAFCCTAAGFIIIFIDVDGYSQIEGPKDYLEGHPIIGIIVMILTVLNPVMALFRPHPGTPRRPIFNWAHFFVGTSAHILGVVNLFFGVQLVKSDAPDYLIYILAAFVAWQLFVELLLEIITCFGKKVEKSEMYEMNGSGTAAGNDFESTPAIILKRVIYVIHCLIVAAFAAVLVGLFVAGKED